MRILIELAREIGGDRKPVRSMIEGMERIEDELEVRPALEAGLVALCRALGAPDQAAGGVFALSRSAGWVAHILEQRLQGFLIRPRAQFTGSTGAAR
jgi:citrate synthase